MRRFRSTQAMSAVRVVALPWALQSAFVTLSSNGAAAFSLDDVGHHALADQAVAHGVGTRQGQGRDGWSNSRLPSGLVCPTRCNRAQSGARGLESRSFMLCRLAVLLLLALSTWR